MKIKKITAYTAGIILLLLLVAGGIGIRYFNNIWFQERVDYLSLSSDLKPINFQWTESSYGDYTEKKDAIRIFMKIEGLEQGMYLQFDTGDPTTKIYRNSLESIKKRGIPINEVTKADKHFVEQLDVELGGSQISIRMLEISEYDVKPFSEEDSTKNFRIGTIGADFLNEYITELDFKNQQIKFYKEREEWMSAENEFASFDFTGRRFMLPCEIEDKQYELFYDSGSSAFGLITFKQRYVNYSNESTPEITYSANNHGNAIPVKHKATDVRIDIGGMDLPLKRVSYVDMYSSFQWMISPFTRIGGWLGNKPFTDHSLIFDVASEEFVVLKR